MKVLELYSGSKWGDGVFKEFGFHSVSCRCDMFDYSLYPRDEFDIVFINIHGNHLGLYDDIDHGDMELGLDLIEYYEPKHWIINCTNKHVREDIMMWGLPYKDICLFMGGKCRDMRVWTNVDKWRPNVNKIYIKPTYILSELPRYL